MQALRRAADDENAALMNPAALRVAVSRWENDHHTPDELHTGLLATVLELPELARTPSPVLTKPPGADSSLTGLLAAQTDTLRLLDRQLGAALVRAQTAAHVHSLAQLLTTSHGVDHTTIARIQADAAALAAWQDLDVGDTTTARHHYRLARAAASRSGDSTLFAHAIGEHAVLLSETGHADTALHQVHRAERLPRLPHLLRAWLAATRAETAASAGLSDQARTGLHDAEKLLGRADPASAVTLPFLSLNEVHLARWRANVLIKLGDPAGGTQAVQSLHQLPTEFARARTGVQLDIAQALLLTGDTDQASTHLTQAAERITTLQSARMADRLGGLQQLLRR